MFGILDEAQADQLLQQQLIGRIGCHANGFTYVVPVSYACHGQFIYVHTQEGKKMEMMRQNPEICFQVDDTRNLANWRSVICQGLFEELTSEADKRIALRQLQERIIPAFSSETMHLSPEWPFPAGNDIIPGGIFFRILILEKTGRYEKKEGADVFGG